MKIRSGSSPTASSAGSVRARHLAASAGECGRSGSGMRTSTRYQASDGRPSTVTCVWKKRLPADHPVICFSDSIENQCRGTR